MSYKVKVDPLARRQMARWVRSGTPDDYLAEAYRRFDEILAHHARTVLETDDARLFQGMGMVYRFRMIDLQDRLLVHGFIFQVFYDSDEMTLHVRRAIHLTETGL